MDDTKQKLLNYLLLGAGVFVSLCFLMMYASDGINSLLNLFTLWTIFPFSILLLVTYRTTSRKTLITTTILSVLCVLSTYLYFESFFDAQGGLIFLFLPLYQLLTIIVGFIILAITNIVH